MNHLVNDAFSLKNPQGDRCSSWAYTNTYNTSSCYIWQKKTYIARWFTFIPWSPSLYTIYIYFIQYIWLDTPIFIYLLDTVLIATFRTHKKLNRILTIGQFFGAEEEEETHANKYFSLISWNKSFLWLCCHCSAVLVSIMQMGFCSTNQTYPHNRTTQYTYVSLKFPF